MVGTGAHRRRWPATSTSATSSRTANASHSRCVTTDSIFRNHVLRTFGSDPPRGLNGPDRVERWVAHEVDAQHGQDGEPHARGRPSPSSTASWSGHGKLLSAAVQPSLRRREAANRCSDRGGSRSTRPRRCMALVRAADIRAGRGDLPHRRLHRPAPRRVRRAALARRRLRRLGQSESASSTTGTSRAEVRQGAFVPLAPKVSSDARPPRRVSRASTGDDDLVFVGRDRQLPRRVRAAPALPRRAPACRPASLVSTTCATRSALA